MVNTVEQAQTAIAAAKYPPEGNRSVGGGMHALNFAATTGEYYEQANDEILVVLQTETPAGVDNAEAIYRLPGCDAIFVGPNDLRFNMRTADGAKPSDDAFEAMIARVSRDRPEDGHAHRHAHVHRRRRPPPGRARHAVHRRRQRPGDDDGGNA